MLLRASFTSARTCAFWLAPASLAGALNTSSKVAGASSTANGLGGGTSLPHPANHMARNNLGRASLALGRPELAREHLTEAARLHPNRPDVHYNLALAFDKARQPRKALHHWQAYSRLDSVGPWAIHARNQIKKILAADELKVVARKH